jgi:hypothetical protein
MHSFLTDTKVGFLGLIPNVEHETPGGAAWRKIGPF